MSSSLGYIFGGGSEEEKKKVAVKPAGTPTTTRISSNAYATGSNQNAGNFITDRPTTRVHAPPGGRSQISFGSVMAPDRAITHSGMTRDALLSLKNKKVATPVTQSTVAPKVSVSNNTTTARISSNAYATGSNQNSGNFITDRPTTRVHAPPGGKSSIMFG